MKKLVLAGGGPKGFAILGSLHYLIDHTDLLNGIEEYWGTSIGSVLIVFLALGFKPFDIFYEMYVNKLFDIIEQPSLNDIGLYKIENFGNKILELINQKIKVNRNEFTFQFFKKLTGKNLNIIGSNVSKSRCEIFSNINSESMSIIDAIEISCDIHYIFTKKIYNGDIYVDGGFTNNYPIDLADNGKDQVLGIVSFEPTKVNNETFDWFFKLANLPLIQLYKMRLSNVSKKVTTIELNLSNTSFLNFNPTQNDKIEMFKQGFLQTKDFHENWIINKNF